MKLSEFAEVCHEFWDSYFSWVYSLQLQGMVKPAENKVMLYPQIILCTQTKNNFCFELMGSSKKYNGLIVKERKQNCIYEYLGQFPKGVGGGSMFNLNSGGGGFQHLCLSHEVNFDAIEKRFPMVSRYKSRLIRSGSNDCLFEFGKDFKDVYFNDCVFISVKGSLCRSKHIIELRVVRKNIPKDDLINSLNSYVKGSNEVKGVSTVDPIIEKECLIAGQLQSLYLTPSMHETTIGDYLNENKDIICMALGVKSFVYEPYLDWIEKPEDMPDKAINPDAMLERHDGFFDICDFKTGLLSKRKLTKGERRRRRFIDGVNEGLAQLANYEEYFDFDKNKQHALEKYKIVTDDINKLLIVGNFDNSIEQEFYQALRPFKNVMVIDYDSLIQRYLANSKLSRGLIE
ncbi:TPA: hypothetical protein RQL27_004031 [Vibrio vulnificus]|nr:hypothetical protein [Vibrio vulnificus]